MNVTIISNTRTDTEAYRPPGGGIYFSGSNPYLSNVTITANSARYGGGIFCIDSSPILSRVSITGNSAYFGGGIYFYRSSPSLENVTIADNYAWGSGCGGIYCSGSNMSLVNSILWNNSLGEICFESNPSTGFNSIDIAFSDVQGGADSIGTNENGTVYWNEGNIDAAPLFVNPGNADYHLQEGSPCIDAGTAFFVWEDDTLVNIPNSLFTGNAPDMGAVESSYRVSVQARPAVPDQFALQQNYPNPFNPLTIIQYELPQRSSVHIAIYDLLGKEVTTLLSETQDAGYKSVQWDATNDNGQPVSTGVYFCRLRAGDFSKTIKIVYLR